VNDKIKGKKGDREADVTASRVKHSRTDMRSDQRDINTSRGLQKASDGVAFLDFALNSVCVCVHM